MDKSNISHTGRGDLKSVVRQHGQHFLYKMLGCVSLVGLLYLDSMLGNYYQATKGLENIKLNKKSKYSHVLK